MGMKLASLMLWATWGLWGNTTVSNQDEGRRNGCNYVTKECHNFYEPTFKVI